jgi:hypothetical protein
LRSFLLRRRRGTTADRPEPIAQRCGDSSAAGPGPYVDAHGLKPGLCFHGPSGRITRLKRRLCFLGPSGRKRAPVETERRS